MARFGQVNPASGGEFIFVGVTEGAERHGAIMEIVRDRETGKASVGLPEYLDDDRMKALLPVMLADKPSIPYPVAP